MHHLGLSSAASASSFLFAPHWRIDLRTVISRMSFPALSNVVVALGMKFLNEFLENQKCQVKQRSVRLDRLTANSQQGECCYSHC